MGSDDSLVIGALRAEVRDYLERHAEPGSDLAAAELVVSELVTNAVRHAKGPSWVELTWSAEQPTLVVSDLGPGFRLPFTDAAEPGASVMPPPTSPGGRGLLLVAHFADEVSVAARRDGGSRVSAVLPVRRAPSVSIDPPPITANPLPAPEEAGPDGTFARESFLRALVVQLARAVERAQGPDVGEALVAQVAAEVGGRFEEAYRKRRGLVDRLSVDEVADCLVQLKRGIGGDFSVVEATADRIVLTNRRCPFGEAVLRAPSLCRMTSSVFGGIAARNTDGEANVVLEERIALGDPGCRVVVHLGPVDPTVGRFAHRYRSRAAADVTER